MSKFTVYVPEGNDRRLMTRNQWLTECVVSEPGQSPRYLIFTHPVKIHAELNGEVLPMESFEKSTELFRYLDTLARQKAVLTSVHSRVWYLAASGLFELNTALRTPALRKGGANVVRHFLENQKGGRTPLRGSFDALLSFLEIRPTPLPFKTKSAPPAKHYVYNGIRHKGEAHRGKTAPC